MRAHALVLLLVVLAVLLIALPAGAQTPPKPSLQPSPLTTSQPAPNTMVTIAKSPLSEEPAANLGSLGCAPSPRPSETWQLPSHPEAALCLKKKFR